MNRRRPLTQRHSVFIPRPESPREDLSYSVNSANNIEVCVRMRPLLPPYEDDIVWEIDEATKSIKAKLENHDLTSLNLSHPKYYNDFSNSQKFVYDNVEGTDSKTKDIFNKILKKIVDSVMQGYNGTIFMYGQTTSGKTFTMLGTQKEPGVLPYSLRTIFQSLQKMKDYTFNISVSYLEIYNEVINDLLVPGSTNLKVVDDPQFGVSVKGLKRQEVKTFEDAIFLVSFGEEHRKYRETNVNEHSSRSHTIYQVFIESFQESEDGSKKRRVSCLNLVDLAGSERLSDNGATNDLQTGETGHINKSLFLLTNVIKKLADGRTSHIPYRDSKLTRILSNAIGGNSLTAVICTISPALINYAQTLSTLRFASRAKRVKNDPTENVIVDIIDKKLKEEVKMLREKLSKSENQITLVNGLNQKLETDLNSTKQEIRSLQKEMEDLKTFVTKESMRHIGDTNVSSESLLDIMGGDGMTMFRFKGNSNRKSQIFNTVSQGVTQTNEQYLNDQMVPTLEHAGESPSPHTGSSIENIVADNDTREWNTHCLKIKQNYLKDLKNLQRNYMTQLEDVSQKYVSKGPTRNPEREYQVRNYLEAELQGVESAQSHVIDVIKRLSPIPSKSALIDKPLSYSPSPSKKMSDWLSKDQPAQNWGDSQQASPRIRSEVEVESNVRQYYDNMLQKMEKKYDDMYNLVTQSFFKSRDNLATLETISPMTERKDGYTPVLQNLNLAEELKLSSTYEDNESGMMGQIKLNRVMSDRPSTRIRQNNKLSSLFSTQIRSARSNNSMVDLSYGNAYLWGSGKDGRLGSGKYINESLPVPIRDLKFSKLVCGYHNTFGVSQDGLVYAWGRNENGQLGVGNNMSAPIPINITPLNKINIIDIACGWQHCLALSTNGRLYSWALLDGCGDEGQLGHGDDFELSSPAEIKFFEKSQVEKIACGHSQSAAITSEGALYTWGHNSDCRLMITNTRSHFIPTLTEFYKLKPQAQCPEDMEIVSLSMGANHMCLVTKTGRVFAGGRGNEGQLGQKLTRDTKNVFRFQADIQNEDDITEIVACPLLEIKTFGDENKASMVACGEKFTLVLTEEKKVYSFGEATDGCLGIDHEETEKNVFEPRQLEKVADKKIKSITAGPRHAACISDDGELYCWGFNYYDQMEVGETEKNYHSPKKIDKLSKYNVSVVSCGYFHTASIVM